LLITGQTLTVVSGDVEQLPGGRIVRVSVKAVGGATFTGDVVINGTDIAGVALAETVSFTAAEDEDVADTTNVFYSIVNIELPGWTTEDDAIAVGYIDTLIWWRQKADAVGIAILDDTRLGNPEVGGRPVPTIPYKAGVMVAGPIAFSPRLEDSFGWLLHAAIGYHTDAIARFDDHVVVSTVLAAGTTTISTGLPVLAVPCTINAVLTALGEANPAFTGSVTVNGTDVDDEVLVDTLALSGAVVGGLVAGDEVFKTITSIVLPVREAAGDAISIGIYAGYNHVYGLNPTNPGYVPWLAQRKYIPPAELDLTTDLGEVYTNTKILGLTLALPNDGLIATRLDFRGCNFEFDNLPTTWDWHNTNEDYESIPIGCTTGGYFEVDNPAIGLNHLLLPVVGASLGIMNGALDLRMERIFGTPFLEDVTIVDRRLTVDITVKWKNPQLYKAIMTGSITGTEWSSIPFVGALDIQALSPANMPLANKPYGLRLQASRIMLALQGGITLAGNQAVLMRFQGVAIDVPEGEYMTLTLRNMVASYTWPTS
jgi:hypothetical protein